MKKYLSITEVAKRTGAPYRPGAEGELVYANTAVSQDACKGATLTLTLSSS